LSSIRSGCRAGASLRSVDGLPDAPWVQREKIIMKKITNDKLTSQKLKLNRQTIGMLSTLRPSEIAGGAPSGHCSFAINCTL
jgi:hypothetical protein